MRYKKLKLCAVVLLGLGLTGLQAQNIFVKENNGTQTAYALNNIQKMTFSSGKLTITETDNNSGVYDLTVLQYLNFTDLSTSIKALEDANNLRLFSYPNPVIDVLMIDLTDAKIINGTLSILNIQGKVLKTKFISSSGIVMLDMRPFPTGIYFCQYKNESGLKTVKIIKQ